MQAAGNKQKYRILYEKYETGGKGHADKKADRFIA
jgi:hypothetical protein